MSLLITLQVLANAPSISMKDADDSAFYTIMMIVSDRSYNLYYDNISCINPQDPDAPSAASPTYSPIRHWLVGNVQGSDLKEGSLGQADTLSKYHPPGPPAGTGYHRYGQFLFKQPGAKIAFKPVPSSIAKWNYTAFIQEYSLGQKVASNYMKAESG